MIVYNVATKLLGTELLPRHNFADLASGITFIVLFSQHRSIYGERNYTYTRTHVRTHARTHTHTHTEYQHLVRRGIDK